MQLIYMLLAVAAGMLIPVQTGFNTQLGCSVAKVSAISNQQFDAIMQTQTPIVPFRRQLARLNAGGYDGEYIINTSLQKVRT